MWATMYATLAHAPMTLATAMPKKPTPWESSNHDSAKLMVEDSACPAKPTTCQFWEDKTVLRHVKIQLPGHAKALMSENCRTGCRSSLGCPKAPNKAGDTSAMKSAKTKHNTCADKQCRTTTPFSIVAPRPKFWAQ